MQLQKTFLPFVLAERLLKTTLKAPGNGKDLHSRFRILKDDLFYENLQQVAHLRHSARTIEYYIIGKRIRQKALLGRMVAKTDKIVRLQAAIRGHLCRVRNKQKVDKIKRDGLKGTKKYKAAMRIQALFRGFAFRQKR
mmetsp:Transcript_24955/g.31128  ORF Transcript_24955/g.31128 Transcript_24955/m.31128 type:complete len:138 (-) Transcript_24955:1114-1527(-)